MKALTGRQLEILNFVRTYSLENGCPPTIRECASNFGISLGVFLNFLTLFSLWYRFL